MRGFNNQWWFGTGRNLDSDAITFVTNAGITNPVQIVAISNYVRDLKKINSIQTNFVNFSNPSLSVIKALYPVLGGTASSHKYNLINPLDTDGAFRMTFGGTITHDDNGMLPNGINAYADTKFVSDDQLVAGDTSEFFYVLSNPVNLSAYLIAARDSSAQMMGVTAFNTSTKALSINYNTTADQGFLQTTNNTLQPKTDGSSISPTVLQSLVKFIISNNFEGNHQIIINGILEDSTTNVGGSLSTYSQYLWTLNNSGTPILFSDVRCGLAGVGKGISVAAAQAFTTATDNFQKFLNRYPKSYIINCVGDSITWGISIPNTINYPLLLQNSFSFPSNVVANNFGVSGKTLADMIVSYPSQEATYFNTKVDKNSIILEAGVNDLGQNIALTKEQLLALYKTYLAAANATGFDCFLCELLPQSNPSYADRTSYEADRQWLNGMMTTDLLANGYVKKVIPLGSDSKIGLPNCQFNSTYYITNGLTPYIHPNDLGNSVIASICFETINNYYNS